MRVKEAFEESLREVLPADGSAQPAREAPAHGSCPRGGQHEREACVEGAATCSEAHVLGIDALVADADVAAKTRAPVSPAAIFSRHA